MYDKVVLRAVDLVLNQRIAENLRDSHEDFELFADLLASGCVTVITTNPQRYPADLNVDPGQHPITARIQDQSKHRTLGGDKWAPKPWQLALCARLDEVVRHHKSCLVFAKVFPAENRFAIKLLDKLTNRKSYRLSSIGEFSGIDPIAEQFEEFCRSPEAYKQFLRKKGFRKFARDDFFRAELYRCARPAYFGGDEAARVACSAIVNLGQSVYMNEECDRERLVGRWGESLREPPFAFVTEDSVQAAREFAVRLQLAPAPGKAITLRLGKGLGEAIAETRRSLAFDNFQRMAEAMGKKDTIIAENSFNVRRDELAAEFAERAAKYMIPRSRLEGGLLTLKALAHKGAAVGWCANHLEMHGPSVNKIKEIFEGVAMASHAGFGLSRLVRSALFLPSAREALVQNINVRRTLINGDRD